MTAILLEYRLRVRDAANATDAFIISSVQGDTAPYVEGPPTCDGQEINPLTGEFRSGSYTGYIVDELTSGYWMTDAGEFVVTDAGERIALDSGGPYRVLTSQLEDATFRQQLAGRVAYWEFRTNGGAWIVLGAGYLTLLRLVTGVRWEVTISDATRVEDTAVAFSPKKGSLALTANASGGATSLTVSALPFAIASGFVLNFLSGKTATTTAVAASGATSVSVSALASGLSSGDSAPISESFAAYFIRWPQRGCVFGGPISGGGFLGVPDLGGWTAVVDSNTSIGGELTTDGTTFIRPIIGYVPPSLKPSRHLDSSAADIPNAAAETLASASGLYAFAPGFPREFKSFWPGLVYQIALASTGFTGVAGEFYAPEGDDGFLGPAPYDSKRTNGIIDLKHNHIGPCVIGTSLSTGSTQYRIRGLTCLPTDVSPLYWTGHPIDLFKALMDEQQRLYDSTACETVRQTIGADRRISLRIGGALPTVNDLLKNAVYAPFGIGVRVNAAGVLEPFSMRVFNNSPPSTTITGADIVHDAGGGTGIQSWFELDESTAIRSLAFEYDNFYLVQQSQKFPPDGVAVEHIRVERANGDPGAIGSGIASFNVPGMVHAKGSILLPRPSGFADDTVQSWVDQLAYEVFDRWGRSVLTGELPLLRGGAGDTLKLGDEFLNALPQIPNKNKRLLDDGTVGARAMQILRLTPTPRGALIKAADSGPNAAAVATLPTFTIAASPGRRAIRFAQITITNASTLNTALCGLQSQMAVTTGATPAATDYTPEGAFSYGKIPTGTITLRPVLNGSTVWVQVRSTQFGARPSAWSTAASIALGALNPPASLVLTPNGADGSQMLATWTPGANADQAFVDVYLRPSAQPASTAVRVQVLDPGSARYNLEGLTPNISYTVGVQSRDANHGDLSVMVEATNTTANVTVTLPIPKRPQIFTGSHDPKTGVLKADGVYGLAVQAASTPSSVAFWEAVETGVGAGTYGTAVLVDTLPSVVGDWTILRREAANDGLRRQLQAGHVRDGSTAGTLTAVATATPWGTPTALAKVAPETSLSRFRCKVKRSAVTALTTGISTTIGWDTEVFDVGNLHDTVTNNDRITIPTDGDTGLWLIICNFQFASNATAGRRDVTIVDNTLVVIGRWQDPDNNGGSTNGQVFAVVDSPAVGSWYRVVALQTSGVNQNFDGGADPPNFQAIHLW